MRGALTVAIEVVYALPDTAIRATLEWRAGLTVAEALRAVSGEPGFVTLELDALPVGVFGELVKRDAELADGDRVELYRPLEKDPMTARRERAEG